MDVEGGNEVIGTWVTYELVHHAIIAQATSQNTPLQPFFPPKHDYRLLTAQVAPLIPLHANVVSVDNPSLKCTPW